MKLLLDSHTWLWLARGVELDATTVGMCRHAAVEGCLYLSPLSVWEVARKAGYGGITVGGPMRPWILDMIQNTGSHIAEFTFEVAIDTSQLPESFHKDPVDRALASTCRVHGLTLLTRDRTLLRLASENIFRALQI